MDGQVRVLLIDDDEDDHVLTSALLAEIGRERFRLDWASSYDAALAAVAERSHDVYLLDFYLGERTGLELLREAVDGGCRTPIIMLTGLGDRDVDLEAMRCGAADYLSKATLDAPLLERAIRYALERARNLEALRESEERYSLAARGANDGLWDWNLKTGRIYFSPRWKDMLGLDGSEVSDRSEDWFDRVHPEDLERLRSDLKAHLEGLTPHFESEHRLLHKDGSFRWMLTRGMAVRGEDGKACRIAGSQADTTGRKVYDGLTGLPNRVLFVDRLTSSLVRIRRHPELLFAVLCFDLDRFKIVNDSLGHPAGDRLLAQIAERLVKCIRPEDTIARIGGDEFAVLIEDIRGVSDASRISLRVHEAMAAPFDLGGREVFSSISVGIAMSATGYTLAEHVLQDAETAMYRAKSLGGARAEVFDDAMRAEVLARLQVENDLRRAVERGQLELHYQPILSLASGNILGLEALVRWNHPERGTMLPEEFIPLAEETGMILPLGDEILRIACRQMQRWTERSPETPLVVSVNVSGRQLAEADFAGRVAEVLRATRLPPRRLKLEITESAIIENADSAAGQLEQLRDLGVGIWLDDFGTGHSSFRYLHRFPIETLKIDRSFVARLEESDGSPEITRTIVLLAHSLGMSAIAEGVERPGQQDRLRDLRCDAVQGYFLGQPLTHDSVDELLARELASHLR